MENTEQNATEAAAATETAPETTNAAPETAQGEAAPAESTV